MEKRLLTYLILLLFSASCNKQNKLTQDQTEEAAVSSMAILAPESADKEAGKSKTIEAKNQPKKVIYTANIKFRVSNINETQVNIKALVAKANGYISNSNQNNEDGNINTTLTIRIPVANFENFINTSEKESIATDYKNINSDDVSEEFYDNEIRLKSKRAAFEKYLNLLKQAKNVAEVMAVEEQIRQIQEEIDSKEGRQNFINNQVSLSTVTLTIYQVLASNTAVGLPFYQKIWDQFANGIQSFINLTIGLFYFIPYFAALFLIWFLYKRYKRRKMNI
jgi:antibiotic biosynthesis monooxygenase (ABM) superfamily enzyme